MLRHVREGLLQDEAGRLRGQGRLRLRVQIQLQGQILQEDEALLVRNLYPAFKHPSLGLATAQ